MKRHICLILALAAAALLAGCSAKLTTVRPAEISELRVARRSDGEAVSLPSEAGDADRKDLLILQLEEPYDDAGACAETDGHLYDVSLYISDKLDTGLILNADGSACKNGRRYVPAEKADSPVSIGDWDALFAPAPSEPPAETPGDETPPPGTASEPPAETPAPGADGMELVASRGEPKPLPAGAELLRSVPVADVLPWSYYIGDVRYDGQDFVMIWRDTPEGSAEWICSITQTGADTALRHAAAYAAGSLERSGGKFLYFTVTDAATFHSSLWCFDLETLYFSQVLGVPCSNMVLLSEEPRDAEGLGWIVYDHYLAAVDLARGSTYEGMTVDLDEYIDGGLFYGIGAFGTHKFVLLSDLGGGALQIDVVTAEPETSAPEQRQSYQIDILTHRFSALQS